MVAVSSWGRLNANEHDVHRLTSAHSRLPAGNTPGIAFGMGRSYGDVCLNPNGRLWSTTRLDKFIGFDRATGILSCEAGVLLRDIHRITIPQGWMLAVTPGTQLITVVNAGSRF